MTVPFLDLHAQYRAIRGEIDAAIADVLASGAFSGGPFVERFEQEFAAFCGSRYALGVASGTDALLLILKALGIGPGDEVITVASTFAATAEVIRLAGATPVYVDVDSATYTMDPDAIPAALSPRTRAIIPVHLFGQPADMRRITAVAAQAGVPVVEDACQAHGAQYRGVRTGTLGLAAAFSFYPGKNLGAYGEAGAVTTSSQELVGKIAVLRNHGQVRKNQHEELGWNARMDGLQAAVLSVKLRHLEAWNEARRQHAALYARLLSPREGVIVPHEAAYARHAWHLYAVRVADRDRVLHDMETKGIQCGIHYPVPVHLMKPLAVAGQPAGSLPVSERCADEFLSLPMYAELPEDSIHYVCECLAGATRQSVPA